MRTAGIIAEYNPFHNGHAYHIGKTKSYGADAVVVALGGEFTQRGEPGFCSKYLRTRMALLNGADLVIEIPQVFAMGSAERFAKGAVQSLVNLGCVDFLSFGSESGDVKAIERFSQVSDSEIYINKVKEEMQKGISVMDARQKAAENICPDLSFVLSGANDSLGCEYIKWVKRLGYDMDYAAIKRYGAGHDENGNLKQGIASASYLRTFSDPYDIIPYIPLNCAEIMEEAFKVGKLSPNKERFEAAVIARLRAMEPNDIKKVPGAGNEGLYNRVYESIRNAKNVNEIYEGIKTKRYAMTRAMRIVTGAFLGLDEDKIKNADVPYIHILGMNDKGAEILKTAKTSAKVPFSDSLADLSKISESAEYIAKIEGRSEDLWQGLLSNPGECGLAFKNKVIIT